MGVFASRQLARRLSHQMTHRAPIPSRHRLCLFLRFISHGTLFSHISGEFAIGISTACNISQVAGAIIDELHDTAFPTPTVSTWARATEEFRLRWDYPAAIGVLDGKHVACVCPSHSGSRFYNYKGYYSIVLLALVDANYRCILYDLGASGKNSDAGIFLSSPMKTFLEERDKEFPVQLGTLGRDFDLRQDLCGPTRPMTDRKNSYFNFKLSRARRVVENYFGMLASRFRVLLRPIYATPDNVKAITLSIMVVGVAGNIASDAKVVRETMKTYFCVRDNVR
ncbi:hypothetical protein Q1695_015669 [Nippostrongylus brasiliensis]|nr:hypothetical protein Q1695_015669 [Nippostrongylus brasiliensis]